MDPVLTDSFARVLDDAASSAQVRAAEASGHAEPAWEVICNSGFADAMRDTDKGGFGLSPDDVAPLLLMAGERLLPLPLGETMVARAILASADVESPADLPIVLWPQDGSARLRSAVCPAAIGAGYALCQIGDDIFMRSVDIGAERDGFGFLCATLTDSPAHATFKHRPDLIMHWASALSALAIAGAVGRLVELTIGYANDRRQFDRPLSKFQAIQHQISVLTEQSVMASVGARIVFREAGSGDGPSLARVAAARCVTADAATTAAGIAHAVHGAIGTCEEHDLQLVTRRLKRLQLSFGSRDYWSAALGGARLASSDATTIDFIQTWAANENAYGRADRS